MNEKERVTLCTFNTHINDSYLIKKKEDIRAFLVDLREHCEPDMAVRVRDLESQVREWRVHNFMYALHLFRFRVRDVDLELNQKWWREAFCYVVNFFYFW